MLRKLFFLIFFVVNLTACASLTTDQETQLIEMRRQASEAKYELERSLSDPSFPIPREQANEMLSQLDKIIAYVDESLEKKEAIDGRFNEWQTELQWIVDRIKLAKGVIISSDISFSLGGYKLISLKEEGKLGIKQFVESLNQVRLKWINNYPDSSLVILVNVSGYTDSVGFKDSYIRQLQSALSIDDLPRNANEKRKALNVYLSNLRAETIKDYISSYASSLGFEPKFNVQGYGEEYPEPEQDVYPPYANKDERRRITKISVSVDAKR